ncbi:MAG: hypothetical protein SPG40_10555 [Kiritimatiellia bacterium]|nr:hypothetical protein [Kiritimatiellia bacterium]
MMDAILRYSFGFGNPNHSAALACAFLPLCWGWRRAAWAGRTLSVSLIAAVLLTQSRTGILVAALEWVAWRLLSAWSNRDVRRPSAPEDAPRRRLAESFPLRIAVAASVAAIALWRMWPRLSLDGSILNRPLIWLSGLRLLSANPDGVGMGNSGALASAYLLPDRIPEIRTLVGSHLTLVAECGRMAGWAWLASILLALCGIRRSPRIGIAFAGLALSACASTVFDWPALFAAFGAWLVASGLRASTSPSGACRRILASAAVSGLLVFAATLVPPGNAPRVRGGYAVSGDEPRTLALYDASWSLREVRARVGADAAIPVHPAMRFPRDLDFSAVRRVLLFGSCREWAYLVPKGIPVTCVDD